MSSDNGNNKIKKKLKPQAIGILYYDDKKDLTKNDDEKFSSLESYKVVFIKK